MFIYRKQLYDEGVRLRMVVRSRYFSAESCRRLSDVGVFDTTLGSKSRLERHKSQ